MTRPRYGLALLAAVLLALAVPAAAGAHAYLQTSNPGPQAEVSAVPRSLTLTFDEAIVPSYTRVTVAAPNGRELPEAVQVAGRVVTVAIRSSATGSYTVRWSVVSTDDGHRTVGAFSFGVRAAPAAPAPVPGVGIPVAPQVLAWLQFMAVVLAGGLLSARAVLWAPWRRRLRDTATADALGAAGALDERAASPARPGDADPLDARVALWSGAIGAVIGIHAGLLGFLTGAYPIVGRSLSAFVNTEIEPIRVETHLGQAWSIMTFAWFAVLALVVAAWSQPRVRERLLAVAGALSLAIAFGLSWASHPASRGTFALLADFLHLVAAALWVGGLLGLVALAGLTRDRPGPARDAIARGFIVRFSRLVVPAVVLVVSAGAFLALRELPSASALVSSGYGRDLLGKSAIALAALGVGGYHRWLVVPRLAAGGSIGAMRRTLLVESGLLLGVLVVAAVLSQSAPPA